MLSITLSPNYVFTVTWIHCGSELNVTGLCLKRSFTDNFVTVKITADVFFPFLIKCLLFKCLLRNHNVVIYLIRKTHSLRRNFIQMVYYKGEDLLL